MAARAREGAWTQNKIPCYKGLLVLHFEFFSAVFISHSIARGKLLDRELFDSISFHISISSSFTLALATWYGQTFS